MTAPNRETPLVTLAHDIEAVPNSGDGFTHYCRVCGQMGVGLAPELPCPGAALEEIRLLYRFINSLPSDLRRDAAAYTGWHEGWDKGDWQ